MATTSTKSLSLFSRLRAALRLRKPKADDNIERHEPDKFLYIFQDFIFGIIITGFLMMVAYSLMNGSAAEWIGTFLRQQDNSFTFDDQLAAFTAVMILLINLVVIFGVALTRTPDNEDVVEVISDLGEEIDERFAEIENRLAEKLDLIIRENVVAMSDEESRPQKRIGEPMDFLNSLDPTTKMIIIGAMLAALALLFVTRRRN